MRLVFFGSSPFGLPTLRELTGDHEVVAIVTQPDRPAGRGGRTKATPVAQWVAEQAGRDEIPLLKPESVNEPDVVEQLRTLEADAWVVIAFGQKLSRGLLEGVFAINLHASLLPRWRGAAPIQAAILAGDRETGNSVITLADRMDAGLVLAQAAMAIGPSDTSGDLHERLAEQGAGLIESVLAAHRAGTVEPREQEESRVTFAPKIGREDGWVRFDETADRCRCRINALSPRPGVGVSIGDQEVKLLRARAEIGGGNPNQGPGVVVDASAGLVACGGATLLRILEVQPAGGRPMAWADFARGRRIEAGERLIGA